MLIKYDMHIKRNGITIYQTKDMCGKFESWQHFQRFKVNEELSNRFVYNVEVIKGEDK